jgi:predicted CoA-binding protein
MDWKANILATDKQVADLLEATKRIAVLGIKPESHAAQPAFYVPKYMAMRAMTLSLSLFITWK